MPASSSNKFISTLNAHAGHVDFDAVTIGFGITRMSEGVQRAVGDLVLVLINAWADELGRTTEAHPLRPLFSLAAKARDGINAG